MIELVKKAMFTGIGMLALTKDKVEELAQDFTEKGKLSEQEGQKLVGEILKKSEESRQELKKQIEDNVRTIMAKMDFASKDDIAALRDELAEIKVKLSSLEQAD